MTVMMTITFCWRKALVRKIDCTDLNEKYILDT
jgi:hypothetical protein